MEKLVELLNEYGKGSFELEIDNDTGELTGGIVDANQDTFEVTSYYITMQIISKRFGFIERLVKNDKINFNFGFIYKTYDEDELGEKYSDLDSLLMILSIQDNPLEYLCSILKE